MACRQATCCSECCATGPVRSPFHLKGTTSSPTEQENSVVQELLFLRPMVLFGFGSQNWCLPPLVPAITKFLIQGQLHNSNSNAHYSRQDRHSLYDFSITLHCGCCMTESKRLLYPFLLDTDS